MVSKSRIVCALAALLLSLSACRPWMHASDDELNLAFALDHNQVVLTNATMDGRHGRFVLATGQPITILDQRLGGKSPSHLLRLGGRARTAIRPAMADLHGVADALLGADICPGKTMVIDFAHGLVTIHQHGAPVADMMTFPFQGVPSVPVRIGGEGAQAVLDTAVPDTILLPLRYARGAKGSRAHVDLEIGGVRFSNVDARVADVAEPRIGNRILSRFLVTIDYSSGAVSLWSLSPQSVK
jgi:hypothetical protein